MAAIITHPVGVAGARSLPGLPADIPGIICGCGIAANYWWSGSQETVFLYGAQVFGLDMQASVAISLVFFLITAIVSLWGAVYSFGFTATFKDYGYAEASFSDKR